MELSNATETEAEDIKAEEEYGTDASGMLQVADLAKIMTTISSLRQLIEEHDPDPARSLAATRCVSVLQSIYEKIYHDSFHKEMITENVCVQTQSL